MVEPHNKKPFYTAFGIAASLLLALSIPIACNRKAFAADDAVSYFKENSSADSMVNDICKEYDVDSNIVKAIIWHESRGIPNVQNRRCIGLMQVDTYWNRDRMSRLNAWDLYDPRNNILVGVDLLSELIDDYDSETLAVMLYGGDHNEAFQMWRRGYIPGYAREILAIAEELEGDI